MTERYTDDNHVPLKPQRPTEDTPTPAPGVHTLFFVHQDIQDLVNSATDLFTYERFMQFMELL